MARTSPAVMPTSSARLYRSGVGGSSSARRMSNGSCLASVLTAQVLRASPRNRPRRPTRTRSPPSRHTVVPRAAAPPRTHRRTESAPAPRVGFDHHLGHLVVLAAPRHPAAAPQLPQRRNHLVEPLAAGRRSPGPSARTPRASSRRRPRATPGPRRAPTPSRPAWPPRSTAARVRRRPRWRTAAVVVTAAIAPMSTQESGHAVSGAHPGLPVGESG